MAGERFLLDTFFIQALLNQRDSYHAEAKRLFPRIRAAAEVVVTEAVLTEVGNALSKSNRDAAVQFIRGFYQAPNINVVAGDAALFAKGLDFYARMNDKEWGLTDCISFVVMREHGLELAATGDHHFRQAGFVPRMSEGEAVV